MEVDAIGDPRADPAAFEAAAVAAETAGYDGIGLPEIRHDVFVSAALAARATTRLTVQTGIAVAFARNPVSVATLANDLQLISAGRFQLGLGSQVRQHIERRFAMPWSAPAARMEEFVAAVRAVWAAWAGGERLAFTGEFYRHTLMTEFFDPGPNPHGNPPILLAAVGPRMTEVAGRVADGLLCHSLTTSDYLREVTLPAVRRARGGVPGFTVSLPVLTALGVDAPSLARAEAAVRRQIAFYASTPAYRGVLDHHGWGELHERLNRLSRAQAWEEMAAAVDDDVFAAVAVSGTPKEVGAAVVERFGDLVDRVALYPAEPVDPALLAEASRVVAERTRTQPA
ncbi:TIGR03617 family F420-dependent LLM class oxidoreductase [Pseudonocardia sp. RS010]|uniref:TIGR03617 family F420-dependent LLM class oxidoreductase n=1 Tax=Pseudonocardia sp. RS010 TaxID=3385979 RepID=UPI0039A3D69E